MGLLVQLDRLRARRGAKKAIVAVASSMLRAAFYMLRDGTPYRDLGAAHFVRKQRFENLFTGPQGFAIGFVVTVE